MSSQKWQPMDVEDYFPEELLTDIPGHKLTDLIRDPDGYLVLPTAFRDKGMGEKIMNMEVREDDTWIITFPKCGTTWAQEIVWSLTHKLDKNKKEEFLYGRAPFLEQSMFMPEIPDPRPFEAKSPFEQSFFHSVEYAENLPSPRVIKTHLPLTHLPKDLLKKAKVIFLARDPRDVAVSYFHHMKLDQLNDKCTFHDFGKVFMDGNFVYGSYFKCLKANLKYLNHPNFKMVWYEDMKADIEKIIDGLQKFLGIQLETPELREELLERITLKKMRDHSIKTGMKGREFYHQNFFRKGETQDWLNHVKGEKGRQEWCQWMEKGFKDVGFEVEIPREKA